MEGLSEGIMSISQIWWHGGRGVDATRVISASARSLSLSLRVASPNGILYPLFSFLSDSGHSCGRYTLVPVGLFGWILIGVQHAADRMERPFQQGVLGLGLNLLAIILLLCAAQRTPCHMIYA